MTGGIRSGKSAYAEGLLSSEASATYLATGPQPSADDAEWRSRVAAHQLRRPESWTTVEGHDVAHVLQSATGPVLLDSLGSWLTATLDRLEAWDNHGEWTTSLSTAVDALAAAVAEFDHELVIVTEEVGLMLVSEHRSGRIFADWLGTLNQRVVAECERVVLVVAGCPLIIKDATPG